MNLVYTTNSSAASTGVCLITRAQLTASIPQFQVHCKKWKDIMCAIESIYKYRDSGQKNAGISHEAKLE